MLLLTVQQLAALAEEAHHAQKGAAPWRVKVGRYVHLAPVKLQRDWRIAVKCCRDLEDACLGGALRSRVEMAGVDGWACTMDLRLASDGPAPTVRVE